MLLCPIATVSATFSEDEWYWFLKNHPDPHFNLQNESNRVATVEEFVTLITVMSYYAEGSSKAPVADKNGKMPSQWCAKYVQSEIDKGTFNPKTYSYAEPATVAFAAEFLSRCKGKYHWDYEKDYSFTNTNGLSAEQQMYLNVAADYHLIPYTSGMDAKKGITRSQLESYMIPDKDITISAPSPTAGANGGMKELNVYFSRDNVDPEAQLQKLKQYHNNITMVSFYVSQISDLEPNEGNRYLRYVIDGTTPDAIAYCNENGILPLLAISNFGANNFNSEAIVGMLSSEANMDTAIQEIISAIEECNMSGVNIGFEHVAASSREAFNKFLSKLNTSLDDHGLVLMTTVGAYFRLDDEQKSFFDYNVIGNVSDFVHVILYDDYPDVSYTLRKDGIEPGPISSLQRIDWVLKYVTHRIPSGKVLLGLGTFGIDYNTTKHTAEDTPRQDLLSRAPGAISETTDGTLGGFFKYSNTDGQHIVYLESDNGIRTRLLRTYRYSLCGLSTFYLDSDHPALMESDTKYSINKSEVMNAVRAGLVPALRRNMYQKPATRAEFCDLIALLIARQTNDSIDHFLASKNVSRQTGQFTDTNSTNVLAVAALGIVNGRGNGKFAPNDAISRQEAAAMLMRLSKTLGYQNSTQGLSFTDTQKLGNWAKESISYISGVIDPTNQKRVMNGTGAQEFSPLQIYTREQAYMTMIRLFHALQA